MAIPVISTTQSVLGYKQWQSFTFQPYASASPTSWAASALPDGVTIDGTTGRIYGAATSPGVYVVGVTATNSDGQSAPVLFTFGIEASSPTVGADVDVIWDLLSGAVTLASGIPPQDAATAAAAAAASTGSAEPAVLLTRKYLSDVVLNVQIVKGGATIDLDATAFHCTLSQRDEDPPLLTSDAWVKVGSGEAARYRVHLALTGAALQGALSDATSDPVTVAPLIGEIEAVFNNPDSGSFGPSTMRVASGDFGIAVETNLAA